MSAALGYLIRRNVKVYFKDKSSFFMSLLSPLILFVLFITFLRSVYESSFQAMIPEGVVIEKGVIDAFTGGWLMSSILGVSCVTIAFCANILMAQDRVTGGVHDLMAAPIKKSTLALSYYIANMIATGIVCFAAAAVGFSLSFRRGLVFYRNRCAADSFGCSAVRTVWDGSCGAGGEFYQHPGRNQRGSQPCQRALWIFMRRIYAHFPVFGTHSKFCRFYPRHLWHGSAAQSLHGRAAAAAGGDGAADGAGRHPEWL